VYFSAIAYALFSLGRFVAAGASYFLHIKPRYILFFLTTGALVTSAYSMLAGGTAALATLLLAYFFEATTWPTIYVMAMRGQGKRIKLTSAFLVASAVSGSFLPAGQYGIENIDTVQHALGIAVASFGCILFLPIFTTVSGAARNLIDPEHYFIKRSDLLDNTSSDDPNWVGGSKTESLPSLEDHITVERSVQIERSV
jgi:fucose permease